MSNLADGKRERTFVPYGQGDTKKISVSFFAISCRYGGIAGINLNNETL
jgi:hypothetical protein